jgi:hypothetical protein
MDRIAAMDLPDPCPHAIGLWPEHLKEETIAWIEPRYLTRRIRRSETGR